MATEQKFRGRPLPIMPKAPNIGLPHLLHQTGRHSKDDLEHLTSIAEREKDSQ